ncbi:MAG: 5'-nucleotidase C-terminal domain-containing protein [Christensenellales bacterium]
MQHYNYDFFSGIHYTIDARNPVGQRVTSIVLDGRELGEDEPVTVCVNSYRFCGTGGYDMLPKQKVAREVAHRRGRRDDRLHHLPPEHSRGYGEILHRHRLIVSKICLFPPSASDAS